MEPPHAHARIDRRPEEVAQQARSLFSHRCAVDKPPPSGQRANPHVHVFSDRQVREQAQFLMDRGDAQGARVFGRQLRVGLSLNENGADIGRDKAAEDILER